MCDSEQQEAKPEPESKPEVESEPQSKPEVESEPEPESKPEVKTESEPEVESEVKPKTESEPEVEPETKMKVTAAQRDRIRSRLFKSTIQIGHEYYLDEIVQDKLFTAVKEIPPRSSLTMAGYCDSFLKWINDKLSPYQVSDVIALLHSSRPSYLQKGPKYYRAAVSVYERRHTLRAVLTRIKTDIKMLSYHARSTDEELDHLQMMNEERLRSLAAAAKTFLEGYESLGVFSAGDLLSSQFTGLIDDILEIQTQTGSAAEKKGTYSSRPLYRNDEVTPHQPRFSFQNHILDVLHESDR